MGPQQWISIIFGAPTALFGALTFAIVILDRTKGRASLDTSASDSIRSLAERVQGLTDRLREFDGMSDASLVDRAKFGERLSTLEDKAKELAEIRNSFLSFKGANEQSHRTTEDALKRIERDIGRLQAQVSRLGPSAGSFSEIISPSKAS